MRNSFINSLIEFNDQGGNAFLLVGDLGYSVVEKFCQEHPDNFINKKVAEQNMASIAAGIASEGFHVFCYSIGNFNTFRCAEQVRNDIDYHNLPVCTVSVGGGVAMEIWDILITPFKMNSTNENITKYHDLCTSRCK